MKIVNGVDLNYSFKRTGREADTESGFPASFSLDCICFFYIPFFSLGCPAIWDKPLLTLRKICITKLKNMKPYRPIILP